MNITPAILPHSFEEIQEKTSRIEGLLNRVQIDLCDGIFGREKTWLPEGTETLPPGFMYEFDIMLNDWKVPTMHAITLGAQCVVAHVDLFSDSDIEELVSIVSQRGTMLGIAVSNDKSVEFHADMVRKIQTRYQKVYIQVMGIQKVGEQGQDFDESAVERVVTLKQQFGDIPLQVDGGMTPETAKKVLDAGAECIVVGSFIFGGDPGTAIKQLESVTLDSNC
jgi:ribulose-phosphate 3-epimerase